MSFANKMAPGVSEGFKNFPSRQIFEKNEVEIPKNNVFDHFWIILELNTNVLEP